MNSRTPNRTLFQAIALPLVSVLAFGLLTWPVWRWLWQEWMGNQYYSHGILIPFVSLFLIIQRWRNDKGFTWNGASTAATATASPTTANPAADPPSSGGKNSYPIAGIIALAAFILLYLVAFNGKAFYIAAFMMIGIIGSCVWIFGGTDAFRRLLFPMAYLVLMVPLPFVESSTLPLALFTGVCSGGLVRFLGLDVEIVGNAVTLPNVDLIIGAQCSGINSLIALTALTALTAYLVKGPLWAKVLLVLLAIPLALISNILRVSSLMFVARQFGAEAGFTFYHDYSGPVFFVLAMLLLYLFARMMRFNELRLDVI